MKQKIKEALRQEYKSRLELDDDQLEGVAAFASTFVTDESKIEEFVKNDATLAMLKSYQSMLDKDRAKRKGEGEQGQQGSKDGNQPPKPEDKPEPPKPDDNIPAWAQAIINSNNELRESNKALSEKIAGFEAAKAKETAVAALDKFVNEWDYAKGFPSESELAKRIALKVYKAGGEAMTGEQLIAAYREEFDPAVKAKGVTDFTKPFDSDGGGGEEDADFSSFDRASQKLGWTELKK